MGGTDGELMIDLVNLKNFSMDTDTWQATLGSGFRLGELDQQLHDNGGRAIAHGTCPDVGIGGHATVVSLISHFTHTKMLISRAHRAALDRCRECGGIPWTMSLK